MSRSIEKMQTVEPDPEPDLLTMTNHKLSLGSGVAGPLIASLSALVLLVGTGTALMPGLPS